MSESEHKAFNGRTVAEAMSKVRAELGKDAYIIEKRELKSKKFFKLGGGDEIVQIIATKAPSVVNDVTPQHKPNTPIKKGSLLEKTYGATPNSRTVEQPNEFLTPQAFRQSAQNTSESFTASEYTKQTAENTHPGSTAEPVFDNDLVNNITDRLMRQMHDEVIRMTSIQARGAIPEVGETLLDCYQQLVENEVNANSARAIVEKLQRDIPFTSINRNNINDFVIKEISRHIHVSPNINMSRINNRPAIISIVGPNGSGKTTTIAKLAFEAIVRQKKNVGLITEDIKRPAAEAQLRALTNILQIPLVSINSAGSMAEEIHNMQDKDLILIDTGGISHRDDRSIADLKEILRVAFVDETHLMLPVSLTEKTARAIIESYKPLNYNRIIFSKIDEAASYGMILNIANSIDTDISYITSGSACNSGIAQAEEEKLAQLITTGYISGIFDSGR